MEDKIITTSATKASDDAIRGVLYLLEQEMNKRLDEIIKSDELIKVGNKTDLTKAIENVMQNPLGAMVEFANNIDLPIMDMVNKAISGFFKNHSEIIDSVYRSKEAQYELYYFIILKSDTDENRSVLFNFISDLSALKVTKKYPVYFQFVPSEFKDKILHLHSLDYLA